MLGGPQGQSEQFWRRDSILPVLEFELQTVQPIASCYTDYVFPAPKCKSYDKVLQHPSIFNEAQELEEYF
jgi:hypothetical protein